MRASVYRLQEPLERAGVAALLGLARPRPEDRVLDVATGTGLVLRALAAPATGVDVDPAMLAAARRRLPAHVTLREADARSLPFADASFDLVLGAYLLHALRQEDVERVAAELARVTAPGGRVVVATCWARRPRARAALAALPRGWWLRPCDPAPALARAGLRITAARTTGGGWPTLVVRADAPS